MNGFKYWLAFNSRIIVVLVFWLYFLFFFFLHERLHKVFTYLFFLQAGIYIGYMFAEFSYSYLKKNNMNKTLIFSLTANSSIILYIN